MYKLMLISLFLLLTNCGGDGTAFTDFCLERFDAGGMDICSEFETSSYLPTLIDDLTDLVEAEAQVYYPEVINLREMLADKNVTVTLIDDSLSINCAPIHNNIDRCEGTLSGFNRGGKDITVSYVSCNSMSTLGHEILHSVEQYYLGGLTPEHTTSDMFDETNGGEKIETQVRKIVYNRCKSLTGAR